MDMREYLRLKKYDAVEPLSVSFALDRLLALFRCEYASAHGVRRPANRFLLFDKPSQEQINAEVLAGLEKMGFKKHE
jgi:hypothetical protein